MTTATPISQLDVVIDADGQHVRVGDREFVIVPGEEQRIHVRQEVVMTWNVPGEPVASLDFEDWRKAAHEEANRLHAATGCDCETKPWCVPHGRDSRFHPPCARHEHVDPLVALEQAEQARKVTRAIVKQAKEGGVLEGAAPTVDVKQPALGIGGWVSTRALAQALERGFDAAGMTYDRGQVAAVTAEVIAHLSRLRGL